VLRQLDEIFEKAGGGLLPLSSDTGGLLDLGIARQRNLPLTGEQQRQALRSALEAGFASEAEAQAECDAWFAFVTDTKQRQAVLTSNHLSAVARRRAVKYLRQMIVNESDEPARLRLLALAEDDDPEVRQAAGKAVASVIMPQELSERFGQAELLNKRKAEALAHIYDQSGRLPAGFKAWLPLFRQILHLNLTGLVSHALRGGLLGGLGFLLVAEFNWYQNVLRRGGKPEYWVALLPVGLMAVFLSFTGGMFPVLGRDIACLLCGGHRKRHAAWGALLGGAAGMGLSVFLFSALAQSNQPGNFDWRPAIGGITLGLAISLGWLLTLLGPALANPRLGRLARWGGVILAGVLGAAGVYVLYLYLEWWPDTYLLLTPVFNEDVYFIGGILGLFTALGLGNVSVRSEDASDS
jgi:hypothetical protein